MSAWFEEEARAYEILQSSDRCEHVPHTKYMGYEDFSLFWSEHRRDTKYRYDAQDRVVTGKEEAVALGL